MHLLDANVLIEANRDYYPMPRVPEFWEWMEFHGRNGNIKVLREIWEEVCDGHDEVAEWMRRDRVQAALRLNMEPDPDVVARVVDDGYAPDLTEDEVLKLGRDPFLIAAAVARPEACVVTMERSKPTLARSNRKIPDVCRDLRVECFDTFELARRLDFRTQWRG